MQKFFKAQTASIFATLADFLMTFFLVEVCHQHYVFAAAFGAITGAAVNFNINRYWTFNVTTQSVKKQSYKYTLVWTGSLILNLAGTYLLTQFLSINYLISKTIIAICVGFSFNYTLQKNYVFATEKNA